MNNLEKALTLRQHFKKSLLNGVTANEAIALLSDELETTENAFIVSKNGLAMDVNGNTSSWSSFKDVLASPNPKLRGQIDEVIDELISIIRMNSERTKTEWACTLQITSSIPEVGVQLESAYFTLIKEPQDRSDLFVFRTTSTSTEYPSIFLPLKIALIETPGESEFAGGDINTLTKAESEVLLLLCQGYSAKQIAFARDGGRSEHTVRSHIQSIKKKLGGGTMFRVGYVSALQMNGLW